jgi:circadian clock protein KaiC
MQKPILIRTATGVAGLDDILFGGFPSNRLYLIEGSPGVGKTTLAMQFLIEGVRRGEPCLYVTLSESRDEMEAVAASHGWSLEGIDIIELSQVEQMFGTRSQNTLFQPAEVELTRLSDLLLREFDRVKPRRMVLDSLSELRLMAQSPLRYRRQVLTFKHHFATDDCTLLLLDDNSGGHDAHVHSIVHGAISLQRVPLKFGINRRSLSVAKMRGSAFREGNHDYLIKEGGIIVFPRLVAMEHAQDFKKTMVSSGNKGLDKLVGGGLDSGTGTLFMGPAGSGKSTMASMYATHAAANGVRGLYFAFDEVASILISRARQMNLPIDAAMESGMLRIRQVDPAEIAPGELANDIMQAVNDEGVRLVVLDSLNGYVNAMPQEDFLHLHLHELLTYLNGKGVATIMILAQHGLVGPMGAPVDVSYLADTVFLMRFFEARGALKKAVSVVKKRSGYHEDTIREFRMAKEGVVVGEPLLNFQGVMTGVPQFIGPAREQDSRDASLTP